jgi:CheY-like chemotaxis protein
MDHSYRTTLQGNGANSRGRAPRNGGYGTQYLQPDPEPLPIASETAAPRIFAFVDDLFFLAKITETARKLNVKVEFVKSEKNLLEHIGQSGDQKPSLIIFDLNNTAVKPVTTISRLKAKLKKKTTVIGFLSHVQGDLKMKALEAGCDMVLPRSAFSQNLPQLLRRHGAPEPEAYRTPTPNPPPIQESNE